MSATGEGDDRTKIHLGGVSCTLTESDLREYFENYGKVDSVKLMPPPSRRSTFTYGFIKFSNEETAENVLADGQGGKIILAGRQIDVNFAKKRRRHQNNDRGSTENAGGSNDCNNDNVDNNVCSNDTDSNVSNNNIDSNVSNNNTDSNVSNNNTDSNVSDSNVDSDGEPVTKLFVGGIPESVNSAALRKHFEQFGEVSYVEMIIDHKTLRRKGYGFVVFTDLNVTKEVLKMKTTDIDGVSVDIGKAEYKNGHGKHTRGNQNRHRNDSSRRRYSKTSSSRSRREQQDPYRRHEHKPDREEDKTRDDGSNDKGSIRRSCDVYQQPSLPPPLPPPSISSSSSSSYNVNGYRSPSQQQQQQQYYPQQQLIYPSQIQPQLQNFYSNGNNQMALAPQPRMNSMAPPQLQQQQQQIYYQQPQLPARNQYQSQQQQQPSSSITSTNQQYYFN